MIRDRNLFAIGMFLLIDNSAFSSAEYVLGNRGWAAFALFMSFIGVLCLRDSIKDQK